MGRFAAEEQPPTAGLAVEQDSRRVVDAVTLWHVNTGSAAGAGLPLLRRERVGVHVDELVAETDRRARVQRRRVRQRPEDDLARCVVAAGAGDGMRRLIGRVRAQEVLGAAVVEVEAARARRLRRPDCEARLRGTCVTRGVDHARRVDMLHVHACGPRCELRLGEGVQLSPGEAVATPWIRVRGDVEPVGIRPDVRVVAEVRARVRATRVRAVVRHVDPVDVPAARRIRGLADGDVEVVHVCERPVRVRVERQDDNEEALRRRVVEA